MKITIHEFGMCMQLFANKVRAESIAAMWCDLRLDAIIKEEQPALNDEGVPAQIRVARPSAVK